MTGFWAFLRGVHYWGSAIFILHSVIHLTAMLWAGRYRAADTSAWLASLAFFLGSLGFQITGNVLPFDKHGVQTAVVEAGIAGQTPLAGKISSQIMLGGDSFSGSTLARWYLAHSELLPLAISVVLIWAALSQRKRLKYVTPWLAALPVAASILLAAVVAAPLGKGATPEDFESYNAIVSWYTWPLHGALTAFGNLGASWIGTALLPGLFVGFLATLPLTTKWLKPGPCKTIHGLFLGGFFACGVFFGGSFAPLTGNRDPKVGPVTGQNSGPVDKAMAERGRTFFNKIECVDCHGIDGAKPDGAPNLSKEGLKHGDAEFYFKFIKNPKSVNPHSTMPSFPKLTNEELTILTEFLRGTGRKQA